MATCGAELCADAANRVLDDDTRALECRVKCSWMSQSACEALVPECGRKGTCVGNFGAAARTTCVDTTSSRYIFACFTYFVYALGIILIDIYAFGGYNVNGAPGV